MKLLCKNCERNRMEIVKSWRGRAWRIHGRRSARWFLEVEGIYKCWQYLGTEENLDCPELTKVFLNSQKSGKEKDGIRRDSLSDSESEDCKSRRKRMPLTNQEALLEVLILEE
jgi:hypothetical protein